MRENEFETRIPFEHSVPNTPDMAEIAPDTTPTPAESTREAVPIVNNAAPNAATLATVAAMEVTSPRFASTHFVKALMTVVIRSTIGCNVPFNASPMAFIDPSTALWKSRNEPPTPLSIAREVSSAWPDTSRSLARKLSSSSMLPARDSPDIMPRTSNTSFMNERRSAVGIFFVATATSRITAAILRRLPFASVASTPTSRRMFWIFVSANCTYALWSAVPAREPLIPMLAITPSEAHSSLRFSPAAAACGPAILSPSKRSVSVCADPFAERMTRFVFFAHAATKEADAVAGAVTGLLASLPKGFLKSLTFDNGKEFAKSGQIKRALGIEVYFAKPCHSWERGTNENRNGVVRKVLPKGRPFDDIAEEEMRRLDCMPDDRPLKRLDWRTPREAFAALLNRHAAKIAA